MIRPLSKLLHRSRPTPVALDLPSVEREVVAHLFGRINGLPSVDWGMADDWINRRTEDSAERARLQRAIAAAWLDELRDSLPRDHSRWRSEHVEGLAPSEGSTGQAMARTAERSFAILRRDFQKVRGQHALTPVAIVAVEPVESYIDLTDQFHSKDGEFATSGGGYINRGPRVFPVIAVSASDRHGAEHTVAHELTHHALAGMHLPLWVEEGFTTIMEQRIAGPRPFDFDHERLRRHREHWSEVGLAGFLDGTAFRSPKDDEQRLAYNLAQWFARRMLEEQPDNLFAFVRACGEAAQKAMHPDPDATDKPRISRATFQEGVAAGCREHLGAEPADLLARLIGIEG